MEPWYLETRQAFYECVTTVVRVAEPHVEALLPELKQSKSAAVVLLTAVGCVLGCLIFFVIRKIACPGQPKPKPKVALPSVEVVQQSAAQLSSKTRASSPAPRVPRDKTKDSLPEELPARDPDPEEKLLEELNNLSRQDLCELPFIGEISAIQIAKFRNRRPIKKVDDLVEAGLSKRLVRGLRQKRGI